jgi:cysteine desulfurase / selenocysteine lyase
MHEYRKDFEAFMGHIWLNAASEGPLPKPSAKALQEAIRWKSLPYELTNERFLNTQTDLKSSIARLIRLEAKDAILTNSASYGLHLLANGIPWQEGDEILLMQNDFPSNILPFLGLEQKGVNVKQIKAKEAVLTPEELKKNISKKSRLLCLSHVHTFSGNVLDIDGFSRICQANNIYFALNISQSVGTLPLDFSTLKIDALVAAGYKWLCGPYGVGFCWIEPSLREQLKYNHLYWPLLSQRELQSEEQLRYKRITSARKYDVFGTANFFNFVPFRSSINYFLEIGLERVYQYNQGLIDQLISGLPNAFRLISPRKGPARSNLVVISHQDQKQNERIFKSLQKCKIHTGFWKGNIRLSPHIYNTADEMNQINDHLDRLH